MYKYYNNIIPPEICNDIISFTDSIRTPSDKQWGEKAGIPIGGKKIPQNYFISQILHLLCSIATRDVGTFLFPEWVEVVIWPEKSFQPPHIDIARNSTKYTSITYLNNNYEGGKTYFTFDNSTSKNNIGDTIMFDGIKYEHGVSPITKGTRYVLAVWYTDQIQDFILNW